VKFSTHTQSLVYLGELTCLQLPMLLNLYDGFLLFHEMIDVNGVLFSQGYVAHPKACHLHASEVLRDEWLNSSTAFKERRIKYEREIAQFLIHADRPIDFPAEQLG